MTLALPSKRAVLSDGQTVTYPDCVQADVRLLATTAAQSLPPPLTLSHRANSFFRVNFKQLARGQNFPVGLRSPGYRISAPQLLCWALDGRLTCRFSGHTGPIAVIFRGLVPGDTIACRPVPGDTNVCRLGLGDTIACRLSRLVATCTDWWRLVETDCDW